MLVTWFYQFLTFVIFFLKTNISFLNSQANDLCLEKNLTEIDYTSIFSRQLMLYFEEIALWMVLVGGYQEFSAFKFFSENYNSLKNNL